MTGTMYPTIHDWLKVARQIPQRDLDNLVLFTGAEGSGKSTLMTQVMRALDPTFDETRVFFTIEEFLAAAPRLPPGSAVALDEATINRRKAMHGQTVALLDFLQVCRGLRLHIAICFPHEDMLDRAVLDYRVRWAFHVPMRGFTVLRTRIRINQGPRKSLSQNTHVWRQHGAYRFRSNSGTFWNAYLAKKQEHMRSYAEAKAEKNAKDKPRSEMERLGWNGEAAVRPVLDEILRAQEAWAGQRAKAVD